MSLSSPPGASPPGPSGVSGLSGPSGKADQLGHGLSLKKQLLLWLLVPQLVLLLVGGVLTSRMALNYAEKGIDQSLKQSVLALARQVKPVGSGLLIDFPRAAQDVIEQDPLDRVSYMVSSPPGSFLIGNGMLPAPPGDARPDTGEPLLYNVSVKGKPMRVALLDVNYGEPEAPQRLRVQVAKSLAVQRHIAAELVADMLVPLLALGAALSILVYGGISRGLSPLTRLQAQLRDRREHSVSALLPIEMREAPQEIHALASAMNQLLAAIRRSLSQEKRFLNDAAHQLRTPLAGLISQTELALAETDPKALQERLAKVLAGAQRSAHLVHQLLSLARHGVDVKLQTLDVAALAREVAREWTPRAVAAGVDLGYEGEDSLLAEGEKLMLREVLSNLLDNAILYAGRGAVVTVRTLRRDDAVLIEVEDNGPGLALADLQHVFERFWRASDLPGGCGLGLAIVSEIARRHGGSATASQVQPQGLLLRLSLPC